MTRRLIVVVLVLVIIALAVITFATTAPAGPEVEIGTALMCDPTPGGGIVCTESP